MEAADRASAPAPAGRRLLVVVLAAVVGGLLVVAGIAFHAVAGHYHPSGERPLDPDADRAFLQWGWLRLLAWAGVGGGAWLLAWAWTRRRRAVGS